MTSSAVHREGVAAFASLPGDSFAYTIDYADADGHVWLKSAATDREWCVCISLFHCRTLLCVRRFRNS